MAPRPPESVELEVSTVCGLRCRHCLVWTQRRDPAALSPELWLEAARQAREDLGLEVVRLTSGEPLLEPWLFDFIDAAARLGVRSEFCTSGVDLDEEAARRLCAGGVSSLALSLDGADPATHDRQRGVPGAHAALRRALGLLAGSPDAPPIELEACVTALNLPELTAMARWAREQGHRIRFQPLQLFGEHERRLWPEPAAAAAALSALAREARGNLAVRNAPVEFAAMARYFAAPLEARPELDCRSDSILIVGREGSVRACRHMEPVGRFPESGLAALWASPAARARVEAARTCRRPCVLMACHARAPATA